MAEARETSQTLQRGLDILEAVAAGCVSPTALAQRLSLSRSTTYRLTALLVERGHLASAKQGLTLGPRVHALGAIAQRAVDLPRLAQPILDDLAAATSDAVNLGVREGRQVIYLAQAPGRRRLAVRHRVGDRNLVCDAALGQALMLDASEAELAAVAPKGPSRQAWLEAMAQARADGLGFHRNEFGDQIVCVAAPVRAARGIIVAAISLSTVEQHLAGGRLAEIRDRVRAASKALGLKLGERA